MNVLVIFWEVTNPELGTPGNNYAPFATTPLKFCSKTRY